MLYLCTLNTIAYITDVLSDSFVNHNVNYN